VKTYMHKMTGSVDTREGWAASYNKEELSGRGLTAQEAFDEDEGETFFEVNAKTAADFHNYLKTAASLMGRKGGSAKSERKTTAVRLNAQKSSGAPWQNWVVGDEPENCIPLGNQTAAEHGLLNSTKVVRARSAEEACRKGIKLFNKEKVR